MALPTRDPFSALLNSFKTPKRKDRGICSCHHDPKSELKKTPSDDPSLQPIKGVPAPCCASKLTIEITKIKIIKESNCISSQDKTSNSKPSKSMPINLKPNLDNQNYKSQSKRNHTKIHSRVHTRIHPIIHTRT